MADYTMNDYDAFKQDMMVTDEVAPLPQPAQVKVQPPHENYDQFKADLMQDAPPPQVAASKSQNPITPGPVRLAQKAVLMKLGEGQLVARGLAPLAGLLPRRSEVRAALESLPETEDAAVQDLTKRYESGKPPGFDVWGAVGAGGVLLPEAIATGGLIDAAPVGAGIVRTGAQLLKGGAAVGTIQGAAEPIADTDKYAIKKGIQTVGGAVVGGVATPIIGGLVGGAASLLDWGVNKVLSVFGPGANSNQIRGTIEAALRTHGIDPDSISASVKNDLAGKLSAKVKKGETPLPTNIANVAALKEMGVEQPTVAQVSYQPQEWGKEAALRGTSGGEGLLAQQADALQSVAGQARGIQTGIGGKAASPLEAGESAILPLEALDKRLGAVVDSAYANFRSMPGLNRQIDALTMAQKTWRDLEAKSLTTALPGDFTSFLNGATKQTGPISINRASEIIQNINAQWKSATPRERLALKILKSNLDDSMDQSAAGLAGAPAKAYRQARKLASGQFAMRDAVQALKDVHNGDATPDHFVRDYVTGNRVTAVDLGNLKSTLMRESPQAWNDLRGQVLESVLSKGIKGEGQILQVSQKAIEDGIMKLPKEKMEILFTKDELGRLGLVGRAAKLIQQKPQGAAVTPSGLTQALMNVLHMGSYMNPKTAALKMAVNLGKQKAVQNQANNALTQFAISRPNPLLTPDIGSILAKSGALLPGGIFGNALNSPRP